MTNPTITATIATITESFLDEIHDIFVAGGQMRPDGLHVTTMCDACETDHVPLGVTDHEDICDWLLTADQPAVVWRLCHPCYITWLSRTAWAASEIIARGDDCPCCFAQWHTTTTETGSEYHSLQHLSGCEYRSMIDDLDHYGQHGVLPVAADDVPAADDADAPGGTVAAHGRRQHRDELARMVALIT